MCTHLLVVLHVGSSLTLRAGSDVSRPPRTHLRVVPWPVRVTCGGKVPRRSLPLSRADRREFLMTFFFALPPHIPRHTTFGISVLAMYLGCVLTVGT